MSRTQCRRSRRFLLISRFIWLRKFYFFFMIKSFFVMLNFKKNVDRHRQRYRSLSSTVSPKMSCSNFMRNCPPNPWPHYMYLEFRWTIFIIYNFSINLFLTTYSIFYYSNVFNVCLLFSNVFLLFCGASLKLYKYGLLKMIVSNNFMLKIVFIC